MVASAACSCQAALCVITHAAGLVRTLSAGLTTPIGRGATIAPGPTDGNTQPR